MTMVDHSPAGWSLGTAAGGPTPQIVEAGTAIIGVGCRWRLRPASPRPDLLLFRFQPFEA
jgi:hypothetical protein